MHRRLDALELDEVESCLCRVKADAVRRHLTGA